MGTSFLQKLHQKIVIVRGFSKKNLRSLAMSTLVMSTSVPILSANFLHVMAAGHAENFQIYVLEQP